MDYFELSVLIKQKLGRSLIFSLTSIYSMGRKKYNIHKIIKKIKNSLIFNIFLLKLVKYKRI